jgi:glycosyltransferase 2 family protein
MTRLHGDETTEGGRDFRVGWTASQSLPPFSGPTAPAEKNVSRKVSLKAKAILASPKVKTAAIAALAVLLLWLFFRGADLGTIWKSLVSARPELILAAVAVVMFTYFLRALRWRTLLSPLGRASLANCFSTTVIGFMVNFIAGRLGEIARPYLLARREGFAASGAMATILLERIFDLVAVVLLIGFWLLVGPTWSERAHSMLVAGGLAGLVAAIVALGTLFFFARYPEAFLRFSRWVLRILPERFEARALGLVETFGTGLRVLVDPRGFAASAVMSIALWVNISFAFWLGARAFDVNFSFGDSFLVIGFLTVGVLVPTPGAIGGYHVMGALALSTLFGTEASLARAVVISNHAISFVPVTLLGIVLFAKAGLSFRQFK